MALESLPMARVRSAGGIGDLSTALVKMQDDAEMKVEKGSFSIAMTMADDMSALLSSFLQNNRAAKAKPSSPESIAEDCEASIKEKTPNCVVKINDFAKAGATTAKQLLNYLHQLFAYPTEIALLLHAFILMKKKKKEDDELPDISSDILESALENLMKGPDRKKIKAGINSANTTKNLVCN
ncbi:HrpJ domain-containing protein [Citrobacter freundii]|uniref:HrpJ domain-containing protein n=1 Tax=Citrobacter freundii TaxID=546 RepID=UPI003978E85F